MSPTTIQDLPVEMMIRIFHSVSPQDLKSIVMVCKSWLEIGEDPKLWNWLVVRVNCREDFHKMKIKRLHLVRELNIGDLCIVCKMYVKDKVTECVWTQSDWIELFELMNELPALAKIPRWSFCFWDRYESFSFIQTNLIVNVFKRLEEIWLGRELSHDHSEQLFKAIAENKSCVKVLRVSGVFISQINPELFAAAVSNVKKVILGPSDNTTHEQIEALFTALAMDGRRLRKLNLLSCNSQHIEPALMGEAVSRLEEFTVDNENYCVTADQLTAIMKQIVKGGSKLTELMVTDALLQDFHELDLELVTLVRKKFGKFIYFYNMNSDDSEEYTSDNYEEEISDHDDSVDYESDHDNTKKDDS